jgi:hypothetical protein
MLTFAGALVVGIESDGGGGVNSGVDAFMVAVQVGGGLLAVAAAGYEARSQRQEYLASRSAAIAPLEGDEGGGGGGGFVWW